MPWTRTLELDINVATLEGSPLVEAVTSTSVISSLDMVQGDSFFLNLRFLTPSGQGLTSPWTVLQLDAGAAIVLAAQLAASLGGSTLLAFASGFTELSDTIGYYYQAQINLNTTEIAAAQAAATEEYLQTLFALQVQNPANTQRDTFLFSVTLYESSYAAQSSPVPATPTYPSPSTILVTGPQTLTLGQQAQVQSNLGLIPGINFPLYLGPGNPLTGAAVTALTGGTTNCLDHVDPTALSLGTWLCLKQLGGEIQDFFVLSGAVSAGPGIVLPTNYNSSTQPKYFMEG